MKKTLILAVLLASVVFVIPTYLLQAQPLGGPTNIVHYHNAIDPSQMRYLTTSYVSNTGTPKIIRLFESTPDLSSGPLFTVPDDQVFVITSLEVFPQGAGVMQFQLYQDEQPRLDWILASQPYKPIRLDFNPGLVVASGFDLSIRYGIGPGGVVFDVNGYLAPNQ